VRIDFNLVPLRVQDACSRADLKFLLRYWGEVIVPIPDAEFDGDHPLFPTVVMVAGALEAMAEHRMTREQALATAWRTSHNMGQSHRWLQA
jgi:hypothetical protein